MHDHTSTLQFASNELERALERFDWLADEVRDEAHQCRVADLRSTLADPQARTSAKERALVVMALLGTARAAAGLRWFDPHGEHRRVRLLHRLAVRECARRRKPCTKPGRGRFEPGLTRSA